MFAASNSTQRPPIVSTPTDRWRQHSHNGGERRHPSGASTRLPQDLGVGRGRPASRLDVRACLSRARPFSCNARTHTLVLVIPLHTIDGRATSARREERSGHCTQPVRIFSLSLSRARGRARPTSGVGRKKASTLYSLLGKKYQCRLDAAKRERKISLRVSSKYENGIKKPCHMHLCVLRIFHVPARVSSAFLRHLNHPLRPTERLNARVVRSLDAF